MNIRLLARPGLATALLGGLLLGYPARVLAQACAMCGSALSNDPLGRAISWSILFMMATPYTIVGAIGTWLYISYRRAGRRQAAITALTGLHQAPVTEGRGGDVQ